MKKIIVILVALIVIGGVSEFISNKDGKKNKLVNNHINHNKFKAFRYAKQEVKKHLKSPSTAKFEKNRIKIDNQITKQTHNNYYINSYVDSENSFGAVLRKHFSCNVIFKDNEVIIRNIIFK